MNSKAGDEAALEITGGITVPTKGTAVAPAGKTIDTDAYSGETVTVTENLTGPATTTRTLVCKADGQKFDVASDGSFTMPNSPVTCTFTNTRTTLKLVKQVEGKGDPNDWKLTATGPDGAPKVENLGGQGVPTNVKPGVEYTLEEDGPVGYTRGTWVCLPADNGTEPVTAADLQDALNNGDRQVHPGQGRQHRLHHHQHPRSGFVEDRQVVHPEDLGLRQGVQHRLQVRR